MSLSFCCTTKKKELYVVHNWVPITHSQSLFGGEILLAEQAKWCVPFQFLIGNHHLTTTMCRHKTLAWRSYT